MMSQLKNFGNLIFIGFVFVLLQTTTLYAQQQVNYNLFADINLSKKQFKVNGTVTFLSDKNTADSVAILIMNTEKAPDLVLEGVASRMKSKASASGNVSYVFKFDKQLAPGTKLQVKYVYMQGNKPPYQYYLDSTYCMAGGYSAAWYPQVITPEKNGSGSYTRATGVLTVNTEANIMAVMASATLKTSTEKNGARYEFTYTKPDIFSLYVGNYTRHEFKSKMPFFTYSLNKDVNGDNLSQKAAEVLDFLATQFGPLNIPNFSIIELPQSISERTNIGGASLLGGVLMPTDALRQFNYALFGHEIGHQWWGNKIRPIGEKGSAMLSEGMAQYGSLQVVSHFDNTKAVLYRKTGYPGYIYDQCGLGYLKNAAVGNDQPLVSLSGINGHLIGDSKGFLTLNLLSETVGKDKFNKALHNIGDKYAKDGLTWDDFLKEVNTINGSNLNWFYQQWFNRTGVPAWQTNWKQSSTGLALTLTQKDSVYTLPLDVLITFTNGESITKQVTLNKKTQMFNIAVAKNVKTVTIDPLFKVIHWDDELTPVALALGKAQQVIKLIYEGKNEEAEKLALAYVNADTVSDKYGLNFTLYTYLARIKTNQNNSDEALKYYRAAIECSSRPVVLLAKTYLKIALLASQKKDEALKQWAIKNAIMADELNNNIDDISSKAKLIL